MWQVNDKVLVTITRQDWTGQHLVPPRTLPGTVTQVLPHGQTCVQTSDGQTRYWPPGSIQPAGS